MEEFKRAQVVMLPANNRSIIAINDMSGLIYDKTQFVKIDQHIIPQHLYIISDDEIKEGEYYYNNLYNDIRQCSSKEKYQTERYINNPLEKNRNKKIIATTNTSLKIDNPNYDIGKLAYITLPQPSQQFITKYIESYNKGEVITDVLVEYLNELADFQNTFNTHTNQFNLKNNVLKVNPKDNTITIKKLKDNWSREEVITLLRNLHLDYIEGNNNKGLNKWIEENL